MKKLFLLLATSISLTTFACINEYAAFPDSTARDVNITGLSEIEPSNRRTKKELEKAAQVKYLTYRTTKSLKAYSDYAAILIYLDSLEKAKKIYIEIEKLEPNLYTTASNLGTLYELEGQNDSALFWIKKSIQLNPNSHNGTEWIHVKILEFKNSETNNYEKSILGLDFGNDNIPKKIERSKISAYGLFYQLRERLNFIKSNDKIMGSLFFDLGNLVAHQYGIKRSLEFYKKAVKFGFHSPIMEKRTKYFQKLMTMANKGQLKYVFPDGSLVPEKHHKNPKTVSKKSDGSNFQEKTPINPSISTFNKTFLILIIIITFAGIIIIRRYIRN